MMTGSSQTIDRTVYLFQYKINFISGNMFIFTSIYFQEKNNKHQTTLLYLVLCIFNLTVLGRR